MWSAIRPTRPVVQLHHASPPSKRHHTLTKPRVWWGRRGWTPVAGNKVTWWRTGPPSSSPSNEAINSTTQSPPHHATAPDHHRHSPAPTPKAPPNARRETDSSKPEEDSSSPSAHHPPREILLPARSKISSPSAPRPAKFLSAACPAGVLLCSAPQVESDKEVDGIGGTLERCVRPRRGP